MLAAIRRLSAGTRLTIRIPDRWANTLSGPITDHRAVPESFMNSRDSRTASAE